LALPGRNEVKRTIGLALLLLSGALTIVLAQAQSEKPGVEKLYILDCG
jgi:N-acyl homoserine lactone hydrolase